MRWTETFGMATASLRANKLRSFLTLVGIIAGVASVIAVMTGISVVQSTMEEELSVLGSTTFQVQKWPAGGFGNNNNAGWRSIQRRPPVTIENANLVREKVKSVDLVGAELWQFGCRARYESEATEGNLWVVGGTPEYAENNTHYVLDGRNITNEDIRVRRAVAVIAPNVADALFPFADPIDKTIKVDGRRYTVVGLFEEKTSATGGNFDNYILVPISTFVRAYGMTDNNGNERSVNMTVRAKSPELVEEAIEQTRGVLRVARGVDPRDEDNFSFYTNDSQIRSFNDATRGVKIGAFVVGFIALLVAGIGIMNIMLVSVTERTREIGIRKALGARPGMILRQFLVEATLLCNIGGVLGVIVGFALGNIVTIFTGFAVHVPLEWAVRGLVFCTLIGLVFGMWPALKASRLAPIEALSFE